MIHIFVVLYISLNIYLDDVVLWQVRTVPQKHLLHGWCITLLCILVKTVQYFNLQSTKLVNFNFHHLKVCSGKITRHRPNVSVMRRVSTFKQHWLNASCLLGCFKIRGFELPWKWNESGFRPPLCTYRLNWTRRTSWRWWDEWDDTVLQTQDLKFEPWRSEAEHATSRSRRLPTILTFTRGWGRNIFCFFQIAETGNRTRNSGM